jgi:hypothetical protein
VTSGEDSVIVPKSANAATTPSTFVRMPLSQHGSRKAIEHWPGFRGSPLEQNQQRPSWAGVLRSYEMPGRDEIASTGKSRRQLASLPIIRWNVAGIDLGSERHWVCAPTRDRSGREVASFGATTAELLRMAEWLKARQVESVAMQHCLSSSRGRESGRPLLPEELRSAREFRLRHLTFVAQAAGRLASKTNL